MLPFEGISCLLVTRTFSFTTVDFSINQVNWTMKRFRVERHGASQMLCRLSPPIFITRFTTEAEGELIMRIAQNMGVEDINLFRIEEVNDPNKYTVFLDGNILGFAKD